MSFPQCYVVGCSLPGRSSARGLKFTGKYVSVSLYQPSFRTARRLGVPAVAKDRRYRKGPGAIDGQGQAGKAIPRCSPLG